MAIFTSIVHPVYKRSLQFFKKSFAPQPAFSEQLRLVKTFDKIKFKQKMTIRTGVYLDLESTSLKEFGRLRILEISLVAVNTKDFHKL